MACEVDDKLSMLFFRLWISVPPHHVHLSLNVRQNQKVVFVLKDILDDFVSKVTLAQC